MKVSKAKVAENRAKPVNAAATLLKTKGFEGAGVIEISARAGLTHGAFYGQFPNKSALAAEACRQDLAKGRDEWVERKGKTDNDALAYVEQYLRRAHIDDIAGGCAMSTYSGEIVRQDPIVATAFAEGTMAMIALLEKALRTRLPRAEARSRALFLMAAMTGTVAMVRATGRTNKSLADEMLTAALQEARALVVEPSQTQERKTQDGRA